MDPIKLLNDIEKQFAGLTDHQVEVMLGLLLVPELVK